MSETAGVSRRPGPLKRLILRLPHLEPKVRQHVRADRIEYRYLGQLHNEGDEPALIIDDGRRLWFRHGLLHRDEGPAVEWFWPEGSHFTTTPIRRSDFPQYEWYRDGKRHNEDGPAVIRGERASYWLEGEKLNHEAWRAAVRAIRAKRRDAARSGLAKSISGAMNRR